MKVSIIIPTLNEALILEDSLHAISNLDPHEIIVADGGSTDLTVSLASGIATQVINSKPGRVDAISADIIAVLHRQTLDFKGALSLKGKVSYAEGQLFSGRLHLHAGYWPDGQHAGVR